MKKLTEAGYQIVPKIKPQECRVETTTGNKIIITLYGETTNPEVIIYNPTEEMK